MPSIKTPKVPDQHHEEDWFDNVENLRPLRGGRRAGTLNEIASGLIHVSAEDAEKKFREDFESAKQDEDPLSVMWNFANWFEEHFPTGKHRVFYPMLYKICTTYAVMERYKNDERMLKLWLKLAESFPESGLAVMEFAHTKGSCRQLAKFYVRWSEMYQAIGYLHRAQEKLELGIAMCAAPLPLLHTAIDALKMQMQLQTSLENEDDIMDSDLENCRETLGQLRGLGRRHVAPVIRITHGPPGKVLKSAQKSQRKSSMGGGFDVFVDESPAPSIAQKIISGTPMVRRRLVDDLVDDPDYQALFGFFDDREKIDLQFSTLENSSKLPSRKFVNSASTAKPKRRGLRCLGVRLPPLDFEVFADDTAANDIKEEDEDAEGRADGEQNVEKLTKTPATSKKAANSGKARLKLKKCLVMEQSMEEAYALRLYAK